MNKNVLIVENTQSPVQIAEATVPTKFMLEGIFTEFNTLNRNNRVYKAETFLPLVEKYQRESIDKKSSFGELDHPDVFDLSLSRASHAVTSLKYNEQFNRIDGCIDVLPNDNGRNLRAIVESGYNIYISSRAAGVTDAANIVLPRELYAYDAVGMGGFSSAIMKQRTINESLGFSNDKTTNFQIYEMQDIDVHQLHIDNNKDTKTLIDLKNMEKTIQEQFDALKAELLKNVKSGNDVESLLKIQEQLEQTNAELTNVKKYLDTFQSKHSILVKENIKLKEVNADLNQQIEEHVVHANGIVNELNHLKKDVGIIKEELNDTDTIVEHVLKVTNSIIKENNDLKSDLTDTISMVDYVSVNTKAAIKFNEKTINELKETDMFTEALAVQHNIMKKMIENEAKENAISDEYVGYVKDKVEAVKDYTKQLVETLSLDKKLNESIVTAKLGNIDDFVGITAEKEKIKAIQEAIVIDADNLQTDEVSDVIVDEKPVDAIVSDISTEIPVEGTDDVQANEIACNTDDVNIEVQDNTSISDSGLVNAMVKITTSDEIALVVSIVDGVVTVKKLENNEEVEVPIDGIEVIEDEDKDILENIKSVLKDIKNKKVLVEQSNNPTFLSFLDEDEVASFKALSEEQKNKIILTMNESEYISSVDVLDIINRCIMVQISDEEKLIKAMPANLKEAWSKLSSDEQSMVVNESKFFSRINTKQAKVDFWNTRVFAKNVITPTHGLLKESITNNDNDAFNKSMLNLLNE